MSGTEKCGSQEQLGQTSIEAEIPWDVLTAHPGLCAVGEVEVRRLHQCRDFTRGCMLLKMNEMYFRPCTDDL